ncbi:MAG: HIT domain-containing protein, partial [Actinomycetales bacterium]|nr:HIT domain-containing protein [Actinomycetales bacterium]
RGWGHLLVIPSHHVTSFGAVDADVWSEACELARIAARTVETVLRPARCYVASLGTAAADIPMSSPHLHLHVLPVKDPTVSPARMLSWDDGVLTATPDEWAELRNLLQTQWRAEFEA